MSVEIVTEAQARDYLGKGRASPEWDDFFKGSGDYVSAIAIASRRIEDYLQNKVNPQLISDYVMDGSGTYELELPYYPIIQIAGTGTGSTPNAADKSKLQYRDSVSSGWVDLFSTSSDFTNYLYIDLVYPYKLCIIENFLTFPMTGIGYKNIRVSWLAGYSTVPGDIIVCCLEMIQDLANQFNFTSSSTTVPLNTQGGRLGVSSTSWAGVNTSFLEMKPRWEKMLAPYRKLVP